MSETVKSSESVAPESMSSLELGDVQGGAMPKLLEAAVKGKVIPSTGRSPMSRKIAG